MSDEIRMTLLHHSTNDLIEELLMWRGRAAELLDRITELEAERDDWRKSYINLWRHINNLPQPPEVQESEATSCEFCGSNKSDIRMNSIVCTSCGRKIGNIVPPEVQE